MAQSRVAWRTVLGLVGSLALLLVLVPAGAATCQGAPKDLLGAVPEASRIERALESGPQIARARYAAIDLGDLQDADTLSIDLFNDTRVTARLDRVERRENGDFTWFGTLVGIKRSHAILVVENGSVAGNVGYPGGFYTIRTAGAGLVAVSQIDQSGYPQPSPPVKVDAPAAGVAESTPGPKADDGTIYDVLVVYTPAAALASPNIVAEIELAIAETNQSFANSGVGPRVRLVHTAQTTYAEAGIGTDLFRVQNPADGFMDEVPPMRDAYCADLVSLWVNSGASWASFYAYPITAGFAPNAYSAVLRTAATGDYSFGVALGWNIGADYDWGTGPLTAGPYNHGYVYAPDLWRTMMTSTAPCATCTRLPYWSNPSINYPSPPPPATPTTTVPMGVPMPSPVAADNKTAIGDVALVVANFRDSFVCACTPPPAPTGVSATNICTGIRVTWTAVPGASSYNLIRGAVCGTAVTTFTGVTSPYTDLTAVPGTPYFYWVRAVNGCGASTNSLCSASIAAGVPVAPLAPTFTNTTCSTTAVHWTAVPGATSYNVYRSPGGACATAVRINVAPVLGTLYNDSGLTATTTYSYYIVAINTCGISANGACGPLSTTGLPTAPLAPTFTNITCSSLTVNWVAAIGAASYDVYRAAGGACAAAVKRNAVPVTTLFFNDTGLTGLTTYSYYIVARNTCGVSANGACAPVTTTGAPTPPPAPTFSLLTCTSVRIDWVAPPGAQTYNIYRATGASCAGAVKLNGAPLSGLFYLDSGLTPATQYSYNVVALNTCGSSAPSTCSSVTTTSAAPPLAPGIPTFSNIACDSVTLNWTAPTPPPAATGYDIYRATNATCAGAVKINAAPVVGTTYTVTGLTKGTQYSFYIVALATCAVSPASLCGTVTTSTIVPTTPTGLVAAGTCTGVHLTWVPATGATSYIVYRGDVCGTALASWTAMSNAFDDTSAVIDAKYSYWVMAVNSCGNSPLSDCAEGMSAATTVEVTGATSGCQTPGVLLTTKKGYVTYQWYKNGGAISGAVIQTYTVTSTGDYSVRVSNLQGCTASSAPFTVTIIPDLIAATSPYPADRAKDIPRNVTLTWLPVSYATSYDVYFGTDINPVFVDNVTVPYYTPGLLKGLTTFYWKIVPRNNCMFLQAVPTWSFTTVAVAMITDVQILYEPTFRLSIKGVDIRPGSWVMIDGRPVPAETWKSYYKIVAKGGASLKAMVPIGIPVCLTILDSAGTVNDCYYITRRSLP